MYRPLTKELKRARSGPLGPRSFEEVPIIKRRLGWLIESHPRE